MNDVFKHNKLQDNINKTVLVIDKNCIGAFSRRNYYDVINDLIPHSENILFLYPANANSNETIDFYGINDDMFLVFKNSKEAIIFNYNNLFSKNCVNKIPKEIIKSIVSKLNE
jgi:hypothetical protein